MAKIASKILTIKENEFEIIIIWSFFSIPYYTQSPSPTNNTTNMTRETFSAFFSFSTFANWGIREAAVQALAAIPIIVSVFMHLQMQLCIHVFISCVSILNLNSPLRWFPVFIPLKFLRHFSYLDQSFYFAWTSFFFLWWDFHKRGYIIKTTPAGEGTTITVMLKASMCIFWNVPNKSFFALWQTLPNWTESFPVKSLFNIFFYVLFKLMHFFCFFNWMRNLQWFFFFSFYTQFCIIVLNDL